MDDLFEEEQQGANLEFKTIVDRHIDGIIQTVKEKYGIKWLRKAMIQQGLADKTTPEHELLERFRSYFKFDTQAVPVEKPDPAHEALEGKDLQTVFKELFLQEMIKQNLMSPELGRAMQQPSALQFLVQQGDVAAAEKCASEMQHVRPFINLSGRLLAPQSHGDTMGIHDAAANPFASMSAVAGTLGLAAKKILENRNN